MKANARLAALAVWLVFSAGCAGGLLGRGRGPEVWPLPPFPTIETEAWVDTDGRLRPDATFFRLPDESRNPPPYSVWSRAADEAMAAYLEEIYARFEGNAAALRALGGVDRPEPKADGAEPHKVSPEAVGTPSGATPEPSQVVWPPAWNPAGHREVMRQSGVAALRETGETYSWARVWYDDGARVDSVNGRPWLVDPSPAAPCVAYWMDRGMMSEDGKRAIPTSQWRPAEWAERPSDSPLCPGA